MNSDFWGTDPNEKLLRDFVRAVRDDRPPAVTSDAAVHAVVEAAYRFAASGEPETAEH